MGLFTQRFRNCDWDLLYLCFKVWSFLSNCTFIVISYKNLARKNWEKTIFYLNISPFLRFLLMYNESAILYMTNTSCNRQLFLCFSCGTFRLAMVTGTLMQNSKSPYISLCVHIKIILKEQNSRISRINNAKFSGYYFYMN